MVEHILGNYLIKTDKLTAKQLDNVIDKMDSVRVKLGLIAVAEGLMTFAQANEVNALQAVMDKRFGDIAVEKGYLTDEQVGNLLKMQGNTYLTFTQVLVDENYVGLNEVENILEDYRLHNNFTNSDMEALKSDDTDRIVSVMLPKEACIYEDIIGTVSRAMVRLIDRHAYIEKACLQQPPCNGPMALQRIKGDSAEYVDYLLEGDGALLTASARFGQCEFEAMDEDALDAAGELLNCVNGLFASSESRNGTYLELDPQEYATEGIQIATDKACVLPIVVDKKKCYFVVSKIN